MYLFFKGLNGFVQLVERLCQKGARRPHVDTHESRTAGAKHSAVVERQSGFVDKQADEAIVREPQSAAVQPHQERCLRLPGLDLGQMP